MAYTENIRVPIETRDILKKICDKSMSELVTSLLQDYVDGKIQVHQQKEVIKMTSVSLNPDLAHKAKELAKQNGIPFNTLVVLLLQSEINKQAPD